MIILDDLDDVSPDKFADDARPVVRASTPTPSLPSYESSQAQHPPEAFAEQPPPPEPTSRGCWPTQTKMGFRRMMVYALVVYFILTAGVGVPLIVTKLRHRYLERQALYPPPSNTDTPSLIADGCSACELETSAVNCNAWLGQSDLHSMLQYSVPLDSLVFMQSNVSYQKDAILVDDISGTLAVGINEDPTVTEALVSVSMFYSDESIKQRTNVCLMNISDKNGLFLYVPSNLDEEDSLIFNITFLFPQTPYLHISEFVTMLPHFSQWYSNLSPYVTFGKVTLGGPRSQVLVGSMDASTLVVKTALAEIEGNFNVSDSLVLETVSAPINVNVSLYNTGVSEGPTLLDMSTGNAGLNASVQLYLPATAPQASRAPNFVARFETFNAPMAVVVAHTPESAPSVLHMRADNSVGTAFVGVDSKFSGNFDVSTTFADADVINSDVDTVAGLAQFDLDWYQPAISTTGSAAKPSVVLDIFQDSRMSGWVGTGARPPQTRKYYNSQGRIEVLSTLSPVALLLGP